VDARLQVRAARRAQLEGGSAMSARLLKKGDRIRVKVPMLFGYRPGRRIGIVAEDQYKGGDAICFWWADREQEGPHCLACRHEVSVVRANRP
jgi:hypothetical protein